MKIQKEFSGNCFFRGKLKSAKPAKRSIKFINPELTSRICAAVSNSTIRFSAIFRKACDFTKKYKLVSLKLLIFLKNRICCLASRNLGFVYNYFGGTIPRKITQPSNKKFIMECVEWKRWIILEKFWKKVLIYRKKSRPNFYFLRLNKKWYSRSLISLASKDVIRETFLLFTAKQKGTGHNVWKNHTTVNVRIRARALISRRGSEGGPNTGTGSNSGRGPNLSTPF